MVGMGENLLDIIEENIDEDISEASAVSMSIDVTLVLVDRYLSTECVPICNNRFTNVQKTIKLLLYCQRLMGLCCSGNISAIWLIKLIVYAYF